MQLATARASDRDVSVMGFFTTLELAPECERLAGNRSLQLASVYGSRPSGSVEVGFVLFVEDGLLRGLDGYTFGEEPWPEDGDALDLRRDIDPQMDIDALNGIRSSVDVVHWVELEPPQS